MQVSLYVASHKVRSGYQIRRVNRLVAETQVRAGETARLLRVVREVCLAIFVGRVADDLYGVLVGTYCTVSAQTVELGLEHSLAAHSNLFAYRQTSERHVIYYTYSEMVLRLRQSQVLEYSQHLCRSCIVRTQTVTTAYNQYILQSEFTQSILYVQIQRLAVSARLFRAVKYTDTLNTCRQSLFQVLQTERTIQVYIDHTKFLAVGCLVINHLADSLAG